jgi:hypothetical protein
MCSAERYGVASDGDFWCRPVNGIICAHPVLKKINKKIPSFSPALHG